MRFPTLRRIELGDFLDLRGPEQIGFVDDQDDRFVQVAELGESVQLDPVEIAVHDEQHEVGIADGLLRELAAQFAGGFVDARRVDQHQLGILKSGLGDLVGRAMFSRNRKDGLAGERVEERALARTDFAKRGDLDTPVFELRGETLDLAHFLFDGGAFGRPQSRVARQAAQRFDRVGQDRFVLHGHVALLRHAATNLSARPGAVGNSRRTRLISACTSLAGRRSSTRTVPRASSISRSTGDGEPATEIT